MPEGLAAERPSAAAAPACLRVRLWPLPPSAQLLRRVVSEVLGAEPADSLPLVVVSPLDGVLSVSLPRRARRVDLEVPLSDLVVGTAGSASGDEPAHLLATVAPSAPSAGVLAAMRAGWGLAGGEGPWMVLTADPVASAAARCGPLALRLAGTPHAAGRVVFGGLEVSRSASS